MKHGKRQKALQRKRIDSAAADRTATERTGKRHDKETAVAAHKRNPPGYWLGKTELEAANLKRQGVKAGVPDLCLPVARNGKHGLYVEMKWQKNKTTDKQDWWLDQLRQQGYETAVCWTAEEAMDTIAKYLDIEEATGRKVEL